MSGLVGLYQRFGEAYCLHLQGWRQYVSPKRWYLPTSPQGVTSQNIYIFTVVRTSNIAMNHGSLICVQPVSSVFAMPGEVGETRSVH
jgi:hypothetical protein